MRMWSMNFNSRNKIVILVFIVLSALVIWSVKANRDPHVRETSLQNLRVIGVLLSEEYTKHQQFPLSSNEFVNTIRRSRADDADRLLQDPWGSSVIYRTSKRSEIPAIYSVGPNRIDEQGSGDDIILPSAFLEERIKQSR